MKNLQNTNNIANNTALMLFALLALFLIPDALLASTAGLPWEGPLQQIKQSVSGPVAGGIALLGVIGAGSALIWGGSEMGAFLKTIIGLVLVISLIITANFLIDMFTGTGAVITGVNTLR